MRVDFADIAVRAVHEAAPAECCDHGALRPNGAALQNATAAVVFVPTEQGGGAMLRP